jgi:ADP-heptose:LPS heptosyltransferase
MVLTRPLLIEIRKYFPNAEITFSVVSHYQNGIPHDLIDRLHVIHGNNQRNISKIKQIKKMRELGEQDIIFDVAATPRSKMLVFFNRATLKIGFPYKTSQRWLYDAAILRTAFKFEAEIMLDMLHLMGHVTEYPPRFDMPGEKVLKEKPFVLYFTGSSKPEKCWPIDRFAKLVQEMATRYQDIDHLIIEGRAEWESIDPVLRQVGQRENVQGLKDLGLEEMIRYVKGALILVSNDTGIRHLAIASEIPTLGIFFDDYPFRYWPRYGNHEIGFNPDASIPAVADLSNTLQRMLGRVLK